MPMLDMPIEELKLYPGISPRPDDFDDYWAKAIAEMNEVEPQVTLTKAEFQAPFADCYDMYFTGVRGARIYSKLIVPKQIRGKCPAVVNFHGYYDNSGDWADKLPYAAAGFVVAAMDCRGQGGRSEDTGGAKGDTIQGHIIRGVWNQDPQDILMRHIFLDSAELVKIVSAMEEVDPARIGAYGGSQGGGITLACSALSPIKRLSPCFPFLSDYRRVWEMDLDKQAYVEIREYFRRFDPQHKTEEEFFRRLGYIDVHNLAPRITGSVLMCVTLLDECCPPSTQFAAYNNIRSEKEMRIYYDYGHEWPLRGYFDHTFRHLLGL
ncbi:MAG: acetylxylan esterase [Clostridia bacterium]|nr:acetylxylan esterase [Clostridia bacterium]